MDPEFGLGLGTDRPRNTSHPPRPSLLIRGLELLGLALVSYGLGAFLLRWVALGGVMIVASYTIYRWQHGPVAPGSGPPGADGIGGDGGDS
jgi:hypothetical protein